FFSSRRRHTSFSRDWSSDVCSSDLARALRAELERLESVHRQAEEWMELVTRALYDPWEVPDAWSEGAGSGLNPDRMPFAMAVGRSEERRVGNECRSRWSKEP